VYGNIHSARRFSDERYQKINVFETDRTAVDVYTLLPGQAQKVHAHKETDKYYLITEGQAVVTVGDEERRLHPGEIALARPGVPHGIRNDSPDPAVAVVFQAPKAWGEKQAGAPHVPPVVERQLGAYNAKDLDAFLACYSEDCTVEDATGQVLMQGRAAMAERYGQLFAQTDKNQATVTRRMVIGPYVIDEEHVERTYPDGRCEHRHVAAVYRVEGELIRHVRFIA
jgi:mannose-6-phosphate isomerase-like protein (cupin superfamily)